MPFHSDEVMNASLVIIPHFFCEQTKLRHRLITNFKKLVSIVVNFIFNIALARSLKTDRSVVAILFGDFLAACCPQQSIISCECIIVYYQGKKTDHPVRRFVICRGSVI